MKLAPIVLFVYNRPEHLRQTIEALKKNDLANKSELFIFSDGPKNKDAVENVNRVREIIRSIKGFKNVSVIERNDNFGLAQSVITGVTEIVNKYGKVIVLEDDLITHPQFLEFMNRGLDEYEIEHKVFSISGFAFTGDVADDNIEDTYFLRLTSSWSWATWKDRWAYFDEHASGWETLKRDAKQAKLFNYDGSYAYTQMLESQMAGQIDSWGIRWYWSVFKRGGLMLCPARSIVRNIGFDGSGIHCPEGENVGNICESKIFFSFPKEVTEKKEIRNIVANNLRRMQHKPFFLRIINRLKAFIPRSK